MSKRAGYKALRERRGRESIYTVQKMSGWEESENGRAERRFESRRETKRGERCTESRVSGIHAGVRVTTD